MLVSLYINLQESLVIFILTSSTSSLKSSPVKYLIIILFTPSISFKPFFKAYQLLFSFIMQYALSSLALALTICQLKTAIALPSPDRPLTCMSRDPAYRVDTQITGPGAPVTGDLTCDGSGGSKLLKSSPSLTMELPILINFQACVLSSEVSYTVGVTVQVGGNLGLNFEQIVSAGVSAAVSTTTETGNTQGVQKTCPDGPWKCSLIITPSMVTVTGTQVPHYPCDAQLDEANAKPYTVQFPKKGADGLAGAAYDVCACQNYESWADPGAPSIVCPQPCN